MPIYIIRKNSEYALAERLGIIKFDGAWRQFVFYPDADTRWSSGCMDLINNFIKDRNQKWRKSILRRRK
jgi:hypothetical protein